MKVGKSDSAAAAAAVVSQIESVTRVVLLLHHQHQLRNISPKNGFVRRKNSEKYFAEKNLYAKYFAEKYCDKLYFNCSTSCRTAKLELSFLTQGGRGH